MLNSSIQFRVRFPPALIPKPMLPLPPSISPALVLSIPRSHYLATVPDLSGSGSAPLTVFAEHHPEYTFRCRAGGTGERVRISYKQSPDRKLLNRQEKKRERGGHIMHHNPSCNSYPTLSTKTTWKCRMNSPLFASMLLVNNSSKGQGSV